MHLHFKNFFCVLRLFMDALMGLNVKLHCFNSKINIVHKLTVYKSMEIIFFKYITFEKSSTRRTTWYSNVLERTLFFSPHLFLSRLFEYWKLEKSVLSKLFYYIWINTVSFIIIYNMNYIIAALNRNLIALV